jgi:hypothetical protein
MGGEINKDYVEIRERSQGVHPEHQDLAGAVQKRIDQIELQLQSN